MSTSRWVLGLGLSALVGACGPEPVNEITETREVEVPPFRVKPRATSQERFGMEGMGVHGSSPAQNEGAPEFAWETPEGWVERGATSMRIANFSPAGHPDAECYLTMLPGGAGGLVANLNRWRSQMGQPELDETQIGELPTRDFLGMTATVVEVQGTYSGMGDIPAKSDSGLLGLIAVRPEFCVFVKMVAPQDVVSAESDNFFAFCDSLRLSTSASPPPTPAGGQTSSATGSTTSEPGPGQEGAGTFRWTVPEGWARGGERSMRLATYVASESGPGWECAITVLPGGAGGLGPNLNRWRQQMGNGPLSEAEIAALPRVEVLGVPSALIRIQGDYTAMGGGHTADAMMIAIVCSLPRETVFIKMTGPAQEVAEQENSFVEFCQSFQQ